MYLKDEILNISSILSLSVIKFYNISDESGNKILDFIGEKVIDLLLFGELQRFIQKLRINLKKEILNKNRQKFIELYNIIPKDLGLSPFYSLDISLKAKFYEFINKKYDDQNETISPIPFSKSLLYLTEINRSDSFIEKIEILSNIRNFIIEEIDEFWNNLPIPRNYFNSDDLLSIFIYLIIKSQLSDLIIDIEIIEDFTKLSSKGKFILI